MLLDMDRDKNIGLMGEKVSKGHILLSDTEFKGKVPAPSGSNTPLGATTHDSYIPPDGKISTDRLGYIPVGSRIDQLGHIPAGFQLTRQRFISAAPIGFKYQFV